MVWFDNLLSGGMRLGGQSWPRDPSRDTLAAAHASLSDPGRAQRPNRPARVRPVGGAANSAQSRRRWVAAWQEFGRRPPSVQVSAVRRGCCVRPEATLCEASCQHPLCGVPPSMCEACGDTARGHFARASLCEADGDTVCGVLPTLLLM